jgi:hypothetical protein
MNNQYSTARSSGVHGRATAIVDRVTNLTAPMVNVMPARVHLAISSSVPAHTSAAGGAIVPDDLLVAGPQAGYVMRAPAQAPHRRSLAKHVEGLCLGQASS